MIFQGLLRVVVKISLLVAEWFFLVALVAEGFMGSFSYELLKKKKQRNFSFVTMKAQFSSFGLLDNEI